MSIKKKVTFVCPFFDGKNITDSSKKLYISKLKKLNDGVVPVTFDFLKDRDAIQKKLADMVLNTRRSALIAIVSATKDKDKELHEHYTKMMDEGNKEMKETTKGQKSEKQEANWMSLDELEKLREEKGSILKKINRKKEISSELYDELLDYTILSLYISIPPRRSVDYTLMLVNEPTENKEHNYYDVKKQQFVFNQYKTKKTYDQQILDVKPELQKVLKAYLKFRPKVNKSLLVNEDGKPLSTKNLTITLTS